MRRWAWLFLVWAIAGTACSGNVGKAPAAEKAALAWTGTPTAKALFQNVFVLQSTKDFRTECVSAIPLTDDDKSAGVASAWCVQVGFLGQVHTFDGAAPPWDHHTISVTVKAQKGAAPAVVSWADCTCGAAPAK